jgi:hypothetical protein
MKTLWYKNQENPSDSISHYWALEGQNGTDGRAGDSCLVRKHKYIIKLPLQIEAAILLSHIYMFPLNLFVYPMLNSFLPSKGSLLNIKKRPTFLELVDKYANLA